MGDKPGKVAHEDMGVLRDSEKAADSMDWCPEFLESGCSASNLERQEMNMREWET